MAQISAGEPGQSWRDTHEDPSVSIILPAFNEARNLPAVLEPLIHQAQVRGWELILVDDGSTDGTEKLATPAAVRVIRHPLNRGYGAALKTGIRAASAPVVAIMDADGQHTLEALEVVLASAASVDLVVGARKGLGKSPFWRMPGKWVLTRLATFITRRKIPDLNSGLRVFRRDVMMRYLHLFPDGFSFSTTSTLVFMDRGYQVEFVPIEVQARRGKSTVTATTGFDTLLLILRLATLFEPLRLFVAMSLVFLLLGVGWSLPYAASGRGISLGAGLLILTSVQLLFAGLIADQVASLRKERLE